MEFTAYLSILFVPLFLGIAVLGFLTWQIVRDQKKEPLDRKRVGHFVFAVVFWLVFIAFYVWRTWPQG